MHISSDHVTYQVATPSLARIRDSFCLVRLLKTFNPVSNPLGFVHFFPESLLHDPLWTDRAAPMSRRRTLASLNTDRPEGLHMALSLYYSLSSPATVESQVARWTKCWGNYSNDHFLLCFHALCCHLDSEPECSTFAQQECSIHVLPGVSTGHLLELFQKGVRKMLTQPTASQFFDISLLHKMCGRFTF